MRHLVSKIRCREIEEDTPTVNSGLHAHMHVSTYMHCTHTQRKEGKKEKKRREGGKEGKRGKERSKRVYMLVDRVDRETFRLFLLKFNGVSSIF